MEDALVNLIANMTRARPDVEDVMVITLDPGAPSLRCFLFFKNEDDPAGSYYCRIPTWSIKDLREVRCNMKKEDSRAASRLAIPQFIKEVNVLRDPEQAVERFSCTLDLISSGPPVWDAEKDDENPLEKHFERLLR